MEDKESDARIFTEALFVQANLIVGSVPDHCNKASKGIPQRYCGFDSRSPQ